MESLVPSSISYAQLVEQKQEVLWRQLESITIANAILFWLKTISNPRTKRTYRTCIQQLTRHELLKQEMTLQEFSMSNLNLLIDQIKTLPLFTFSARGASRIWAEATRQQRAAAFLCFTSFLHRRTNGLIPKAMPCKEGQNRTFYRVRQKVKTIAFRGRTQWLHFLQELEAINPRDALVAKIMLQGGKRISEVLYLQTSQIDFVQGEITFQQAKTRGTAQITVISFRQEILHQLQTYLGDRQGTVFVTKYGAPLSTQQIERNFKKAGQRAHIPFTVTPHVLRTTTVTYLKQQGFSDSDIMKVTGHTSSNMIGMYDKSSLADNASKKINLV